MSKIELDFNTLKYNLYEILNIKSLLLNLLLNEWIKIFTFMIKYLWNITCINTLIR